MLQDIADHAVGSIGIKIIIIYPMKFAGMILIRPTIDDSLTSRVDFPFFF